MDSFLYSYLIVLTYLFTSLTSEDVQEKVQAVVGFSGELPCNVTAEKEGDVLESIAWYRDGSSAAFYSRDFREGGDDAPEGRYRLIATDGQNIDRLQIQSVEMSDEGSYTCVASFLGSPTQKIALTLEVIEPPQRMWVLEYEGGGGGTRQVTMAVAGSNASKDIGPYYIGDTLRLLCISYRGKPPPSLTWRSEWRELPQTRDTLSPLRASSNLTYGPLAREDHGRVLTCRAHNHRDAPALTIDLTLDMHLPPELVAVRALGSGATRARAGDELALQCRVLGARPPPALEWRLADTPLHLQQNVTTEASQRLVASTVRLRAAPEHDEAALTCCAPAPARDPGVFVCAPPATLTVTYPPILNISIEAEGVITSNGTVNVVKGSNVTLNCTYKANPPIYQLLWFHESDTTHAHPQPEADGGTSVEPVLRLVVAAERDAGEYACAAFNDEGPGYSEPVYVDVTYPAYCEDETTAEYGLAEGESLTLRCGVHAHPPPAAYRWLLVDGAGQPSNFTTDVPFIEYKRPDNTTFNKIQCWGLNEVDASELPHTPCTFHVTDETAPRPPARCGAIKSALKDIAVTCHKGHDGGLPQKFTFTVLSKSNETLTSITSLEPKFIIQEPEQENYRFLITASNNKGDSTVVTIDYENIIDEAAGPTRPPNAVPDITTLSLSLCGGVLLLALVACGLVLCSRERLERADARRLPHPADEPPLCAYNTEESNCETYHDSDDGSDFNVRRTESFRRAVSRYPSQNYDVRRTSSFHSARGEPEPAGKCGDAVRHSAACRIHSLQNINRKRDMDALCDHLITEIPSEINYNIPRPMNTFYTMPRKIRQKLPREISDETSEITQTSDGFSLPPPPDEFTSYRAGVRIRDLPPKPAATYTTIVRNSPKHQQRIAVSSVNTIGIPTSDGARESLYTYPDDEYRKPVSNTTNPFGDSS